MGTLLIKVVTVVTLVSAIRGLSRRLGPHWGGLLLGLPISTAVVLAFYGREQGVTFAVQATSDALLGLMGAVALALTYGVLAGRGWRLPATLLAASAAYAGVSLAFSCLAPAGDAARLLCCLAGVVAACLAARGGTGRGATGAAPAVVGLRGWALRVGVPAACVVGVTSLAGLVGHPWAGLLSTFPSALLAVLVLTHVEGPTEAVRLTAAGFPQGQFSMIAFIKAFALCCHVGEGLFWGLVGGYAAALLVLAVSATFGAGGRGDSAAGPAPRSDAAPADRRGGRSCGHVRHALARVAVHADEYSPLPARPRGCGDGWKQPLLT